MRSDFNIHPAATEEFNATIRHYAFLDEDDQEQPLATAFDMTFNRYLSLIIDNPLVHNIRRRNTRRVNLTPRFGEHYIAYMIWREKVVILAIASRETPPLLLAQAYS